MYINVAVALEARAGDGNVIVGRDLNEARGILYIAIQIIMSRNLDTLAELQQLDRRPEAYRRQHQHHQH